MKQTEYPTSERQKISTLPITVIWVLSSDCTNAGVMAKTGDHRGYLELSQNPIRFEPVSKVTNVFFDDTSKEVS